MRPILLQFFLVFMAYSGVSQDSKKTNLQSLIDTELAFARMAKVENTRNAFLHYLDEETVMFVDGEIKIGKKLWEDRKPDSTLLIWQPVFADISASGDFGYTTGPSEYYENRKAGTKAFHGSYITMWKRDSGQDWKMALDIGVYPQPEPTSKSLMTPTLMANQKGPTKKKSCAGTHEARDALHPKIINGHGFRLLSFQGVTLSATWDATRNRPCQM